MATKVEIENAPVGTQWIYKTDSGDYIITKYLNRYDIMFYCCDDFDCYMHNLDVYKKLDDLVNFEDIKNYTIKIGE